jgi:hypothetical protein
VPRARRQEALKTPTIAAMGCTVRRGRHRGLLTRWRGQPLRARLSPMNGTSCQNLFPRAGQAPRR